MPPSNPCIGLIGFDPDRNAANKIVSNPKGWLIVPSAPPADIDFVATTIGSSTSRRVITQLCDIVHPSGIKNSTELASDDSWYPVVGPAYECKRDKAGLDLVGNFSVVHNASLNETTGHVFVVGDYTDSTMSKTTRDIDLQGPTLWYAVLLQVQQEFVTRSYLQGYATENKTTGKNSILDPLVHAALDNDEVSRILTCSTELSDVVRCLLPCALCSNLHAYIHYIQEYSYANRSYIVNSWTAMNNTTSFAFVSAMRQTGAGWAQLQQGLQSTVAAANSSEDIAFGWASTYDQTMLNVGSVMLHFQDPVSVVQSHVTQVTRIPRAPLLTLIMLDLLYALIGTCLAITALIAVRKGRSVHDAQARLSTLAIVAESFESPAWGEDARDVDMLFAERRGEPTRRIALVKQADGKGRKYKQLVVPKDYLKRAPTVGEFLTRKTRLGGGGSQV